MSLELTVVSLELKSAVVKVKGCACAHALRQAQGERESRSLDGERKPLNRIQKMVDSGCAHCYVD